MEFSDVIQNRYACKKFDGTPVAKEALDAILAAGRLAPTGAHALPLRRARRAARCV